MGRLGRVFAITTILVCSASLAGCGFGVDDVQLNGGIFDALGVGSNSKPVGRSEKQIAARAPLVVPPGLESLPEPGAPVESQDPVLATINDPDEVRGQSREELERQHQDYCDKNYNEHAEDAQFVEGPLGPCRKSVLTAVKKWNDSDDESQ